MRIVNSDSAIYLKVFGRQRQTTFGHLSLLLFVKTTSEITPLDDTFNLISFHSQGTVLTH